MTTDTVEKTISPAGIILQQLGGNRFIAMTGAKNFGFYGNTLKFQIPNRKARYVTITLDDSDTYTMTFKKLVRVDLVTVAEHTGVYDDMLQSTFTEVTGLYTSL
jgi:hypothetical protein